MLSTLGDGGGSAGLGDGHALVATETGVLHQLRTVNPKATFEAVSPTRRVPVHEDDHPRKPAPVPSRRCPRSRRRPSVGRTGTPGGAAHGRHRARPGEGSRRAHLGQRRGRSALCGRAVRWADPLDVLVVGSGVAGLTAALSLAGPQARRRHRQGDATAGGSTVLAQGGIAAAIWAGRQRRRARRRHCLGCRRPRAIPRWPQLVTGEAADAVAMLAELACASTSAPRPAREGTASPVSCTPGVTPRGPR